MMEHHPIFSKFEVLTSDTVPVEYHWGFLGEVEKKAYEEELAVALGLVPITYTPGQTRRGDIPPINDEYHQWIDVLESVVSAQGSFTMIELGAGFGRWLVRGGVAVRRYHGDLPMRLIGVEAEPTHFQWLKKHLSDNGLDCDPQDLLEAAVDAQDGEVLFQVGEAATHYGQAIIRDEHLQVTDSVQRVKAVGLNRILEGVERVDLIDLDIQGAEYVVLESAIESLNAKVKRIHIGTHSHAIEQDLRALFRAHGWYKLNDYSYQTVEMTEWGAVKFGDGVQTWINPRLSALPVTEAELQRLQWMLAKLEAEVTENQTAQQELTQAVSRLQSQLEQYQAAAPAPVSPPINQAELDQLRTAIAAMESSKFWKLRTAWINLKRRFGLAA